MPADLAPSVVQQDTAEAREAVPPCQAASRCAWGQLAHQLRRPASSICAPR